MHHICHFEFWMQDLTHSFTPDVSEYVMLYTGIIRMCTVITARSMTICFSLSLRPHRDTDDGNTGQSSELTYSPMAGCLMK